MIGQPAGGINPNDSSPLGGKVFVRIVVVTQNCISDIIFTSEVNDKYMTQCLSISSDSIRMRSQTPGSQIA